MTSATTHYACILLTIINSLVLLNGQQISSGKCDENAVNTHMLECYQQHIDTSMNDHFIDGFSLCQAFNGSSSYRQCLYSIFAPNQICSYDRHPYSYQSFKVYWKLIISSCLVEGGNGCSPAKLSERIFSRCHYSFDENFPTRCREFLRAVKCLQRHEKELVTGSSLTACSRNQALFDLFADLAARLQLAINTCEQI